MKIHLGLVLEFMKRAEAEGVRYVSDESLVLCTEEEGQPLECRTRFEPVKSTEAVQETVMRKKSVEHGEKPACTDKVMRLKEPMTLEAEACRE